MRSSKAPVTGVTVAGKLLISAKELAAVLGVHRSTIWSWHSAGRVPMPLKLGGVTRWRADEIRAWLEAGAPAREQWSWRRENSTKI